jgi:hypothetical protein
MTGYTLRALIMEAYNVGGLQIREHVFPGERLR